MAAAALLLAGLLSPGYDPVRTTVSHLGQRGQPYALAVNLTFAGLGLAYLAVAWAARRTRASAALLALAGIALVGVAIVSRDPVRPLPHRAVALALFAALALAPLFSAGGRRWSIYSRATFAASVLLLIAGVASIALHAGVPAGAWERVYVGINLAWLVALSVRLRRLAST